MKILIFRNAVTASAETARRILAQLNVRPTSVLGLATGGTMKLVYDAMSAALAPGPAQFTSFNLDEYIGLSPSHPQSYAHYMKMHLFDAIALPAAQAHVPRGDAADPTAEAARYEAAIVDAGGIDLQLLGLGANGHIGFNEPTSSLGSRTRIKTLTRKTVADNARFFGPQEFIPQTAITMGIKTILDTRAILLLATGSGKSDAVAQMVEGSLSAACPATALQLHPNVTVLIDETAAAGLKLRDYYETVHPDGADAVCA